MSKLLNDLLRLFLMACVLAAIHWAWRGFSRSATLPTLTVDEFLAHRDDYEAVDARTDAEFKIGHIPGAINLSVSQAMQKRKQALPLLPFGRGKAVVVYCEGGACNASVQVGGWLREQGYQITLLSGGYPAWLAAQGQGP